MNISKPTTYEEAIKVAAEVSQIADYEEKLKFWDAHPDVFGDASVLVFDKQDKVYNHWHGKPYGYFELDPKPVNGVWDWLKKPRNVTAESNEDRYEAVWIWPNDLTEFEDFMDWCVPKAKFWDHFDITDQAYYWRQIKNKRESFREDYLTSLLLKAEELRDCVKTLPNPFGPTTIADDLARDYFFWYGNQDASGGDVGGFNTYFYLHSIFTDMPTRSLSDYGVIFSRYWHGYHTAVMVDFLRDQKKRLDRGEDITTPAPTTSTPDTTPAPEQPTTKLPIDQPPAPALFLVPKARQALCDALIELVEQEDQPALSALILEGTKPANRIIIHSLKPFGEAFYKANAVPINGADLLSKQLPDYFLRSDGMELIELRSGYLVKLLRGGEAKQRKNDEKRNNP